MKNKKYDYRVLQENNSWTTEILRRKTAKETIVSKSQSGFSSEVKAEEWGQTELKSFLQNLSERNKRRSKPVTQPVFPKEKVSKPIPDTE